MRIAVNTGEALVSVDARPEAGEGMVAGDVVNTAARLQSAAPVNGVLVGEATRRATERVIDYAEAEPVDAKGKAEPVAVSEAVAARARFGVDLGETARTPLVGRERELDLLRSALARVRDEQAPHLVTLVGVPGIGKSRLVRELFDEVDRVPDLIGWRQGRSLPYGEGVTYWALAEMVKAQAGILESDDPDEVQRKLARSVGELVGADEAVWVEPHLRTLLGQGDQRGDTRADAFAAWQRYLEGIADTRAGRARVRGCALGRRRSARLHRPPRRLGDRRAAAARLHGAAGAHRPPSRLGRGQAQRDDGVALAALS